MTIYYKDTDEEKTMETIPGYGIKIEAAYHGPDWVWIGHINEYGCYDLDIGPLDLAWKPGRIRIEP